ncbi:MAG: hypothetical protein ACE5KZ_08615 [Candidatus Scalinduaceae bacterium]
MKVKNISKISGLGFLFIMISTANMSFTIGDEITYSFSKPGYKPVPDTCPYIEGGGELNDNFLYKKWCEETFDNGNYIYEAYKNIAFNIKYAPEPPKTDSWQTPLETARLKRGDCEDVVLHFFSQLPPKQTNAVIIWGWVIDRRSGVGMAHVWYQLTDKTGQRYVVEGFSKDWNGIIPMEIVQYTEIRKPILRISHCMVNRLSHLFPEVEDWQMCQTLVDLFATTRFITHVSGRRFFSQDISIQLHLSAYEFIEYPTSAQYRSREYTQFPNYSPRRKIAPNVNKRISNILKKLHEVFSRYENQKRDDRSNIQVSHKSNMELIYSERNLKCRR